MLKRNLLEHATGAFYSSDILADLLQEYLLEVIVDGALQQDVLVALRKKCYFALEQTLNQRHPKNYRLDDARKFFASLAGDNMFESAQLPMLGHLFERLMYRNGDLLCYRETEVQAYVRLAAEVDPTLLAAWHLSGWLSISPAPDAHDICRVVSSQNPFFAPMPNPSASFAEGHVHLGGVSADDFILSSHLLTDSVFSLKKSPELKEKILQLRRLLGVFLQAGEITQSESALNIADALLNPMRMDLPDWKVLMNSNPHASIGSAGWICTQLGHAKQLSYSHNVWMWLLLLMCQLYRNEDTSPYVRVAILYWLVSIMSLRRSLIMDGQGLTQFVENYFNGDVRKKGGSSLLANVRQLMMGERDVAEVKSMPSAYAPNYIGKLVGAISHQGRCAPVSVPYIFGEHEVSLAGVGADYLKSMERWHFCGHFSRSKKNYNHQASKADMVLVWETAQNILKSLSSQTGWNKPEFLNGYLNPNFHFQPSNWFRGLDVAGNENNLKIEWFSPALRWLRRGFIPRPIGTRTSTGFHLSIHAGEDYAHPLSGMRHVDETVSFCEMRDGDRLGHALALGIDPSEWATRQGDMVLPLDEHLDNLVWAWHYAAVLSARLPLAHQVLPILARRISRFSPYSGWNQSPIFDVGEKLYNDFSFSRLAAGEGVVSPELLFKAWQLRRNCYYRWQQLGLERPQSELEQYALPDWNYMDREASQSELTATRIYINRHQHIDQQSQIPLVLLRAGGSWEAQEFSSMRDGMNNENIIHDIDTLQELEFMHALQDYLLDKYDELGLIIETNPTSNVYIARLESHQEHPIFRWNPPNEFFLNPKEKFNRYGLRRGPMRVLINTDDPGIMLTTLRTEFSLLREAAIELGASRTIADEWLERLRLFGIQQFHRNHLSVFGMPDA